VEKIEENMIGCLVVWCHEQDTYLGITKLVARSVVNSR
jgi:hypothetical protein